MGLELAGAWWNAAVAGSSFSCYATMLTAHERSEMGVGVLSSGLAHHVSVFTARISF